MVRLPQANAAHALAGFLSGLQRMACAWALALTMAVARSGPDEAPTIHFALARADTRRAKVLH